jgi:hypothetical protein
MGLKKGEKVEPLAILRVTSVRTEPLCYIAEGDARREGFPDMTEAEFVEMFCRKLKCGPDERVTRIEFTYEDPRAWVVVRNDYGVPVRMEMATA